MEQLISVLGAGPRKWVMKNKPANLGVAITLLEDYLGAEEPLLNRGMMHVEKHKGKDKMAEAAGSANLKGPNSQDYKKTWPDCIEFVNLTGSQIPRPTTTAEPAQAQQAATWSTPEECMVACYGCGQFGHVKKLSLIHI